MADYVVKSQVKIEVDQGQEHLHAQAATASGTASPSSIGNQRLLFHGSRIQNWVGILSRGILLPKIVVSMGVNRTDAGWLGNGIYFGDAACTSVFYTTPGKQEDAPDGHRPRGPGQDEGLHQDHLRPDRRRRRATTVATASAAQARAPSQFADDEYVIYDPQQQRLEYLVEFTA